MPSRIHFVWDKSSLIYSAMRCVMLPRVLRKELLSRLSLLQSLLGTIFASFELCCTDSCAFCSDTSCLPPTTPFPKTIQDGDDCYLYISVSGELSVTERLEMTLNLRSTDSGPGLAKEDVSLLFKRFSQATKQSNKVFGGSGLGLWISKQISHQSEYPVVCTACKG